MRTCSTLSLAALLVVSAHAVERLIEKPRGIGQADTYYTTRFFNQTIDHFNPQDSRHFEHRYLVNDTYWGESGGLPNGCKGPVLLYTGNEGPITDFWDVSGFVTTTLAKDWGAYVIFVEERYYGASLPFGADTFQDPANLAYLTTEQVLADYAVVVQELKATTPGMLDCPVVAFGGSYGATLTTFFRQTYPNVVIGGLAASAPTGYYDSEAWPNNDVDEYTWASIVSNAYNQLDGCLDAVFQAVNVIDSTPVDELAPIFNLCEASGLGPTSNADLFTYTLEGYPQGDYPTANPPNPVDASCQLLLQAGDNSTAILEAASEIISWSYGNSDGSCIETLAEGPGDVPGDGPGDPNSSWGYQSCTQTLHPFSSSTVGGLGIRNYTFSPSAIDGVCDSLYNGLVTPNLEALTTMYGGYKIPANTQGITNIIWSNGGRDPWHGGGFYASGVTWKTVSDLYTRESGERHFLYMPDTAHHEDLRLPSDADPVDLVEARQIEKDIIWGWIQAATNNPTTSSGERGLRGASFP